MERLDLREMPDRPDIEAAIHCARYAIAKGLVAGKRVLDVACGEGYGSYLLKEAGASSVVGVDIDEPTIERCKDSFKVPGLEFLVASAETLSELFKAGEFDVVVSIETIEHVPNPEHLLRGIKHVLKPGGVVIITCPNDAWYYKDSARSNPFHKTRFSPAYFRSLSSRILGHDAQWGLGTASIGFVSSPLPQGVGCSTIPNSWLSRVDNTSSYVVTTDHGTGVTDENCSYFVGVWGARTPVSGSAIFPVSMDTYSLMMQAIDTAQSKQAASDVDQHTIPRFETRDGLDGGLSSEHEGLAASNDTLRSQLAQLTQDKNELAQQLQDSERNNRILGLRFSATSTENLLLRESAHTTRRELQDAQHAVRAIQHELQAAQQELQAAQQELHCAQHELRSVHDQAQAAQHALQAAQHELHREREEKVPLRIGHDRYVKLKAVIPGFVRAPMIRSYRLIRKAVRG